MSDYDDELVRGAFAEFRAEAADRTSTQDLGRVHTMARHRRRVHTVALGAVAAVLLAVPIGGYAAVVHHEPPAPLTPVPAQSPDRTPPPSASPSPSPSTAAPVAAAPDGRFTIDQLTHMTVNLPAWPSSALQGCPSGRFTFTGNPTQAPDPAMGTGFVFLQIDKVSYVDADRDGAMETAALVNCYLQGGDQQVVVLDRDRAGHIATVGQAIASGGDKAAVQQVFDVRPAANGRDVEAQVGDLHPCCGAMPEDAEHQWRGYRWNGRAFYQVSGPTKFTPKVTPTDLSVTATAVRLGAISNGVRTGTFTVTVTNKGPANAPGWFVTARWHTTAAAMPDDVVLSGPAGSVYTPRDSDGLTTLVYHGPALATGASRSFTVTVTVPQSDDLAIPVTAGPASSFTFGLELVEEQLGVRVIADPNGGDNLTDVTVSRPA